MKNIENTKLSPEQKKRWIEGVDDATEALASTSDPIMIMDEILGIGTAPDVYAMGWNCVYASEENKARRASRENSSFENDYQKPNNK